MCKCLYCYKELGAGEQHFHKACAKRMFGTGNAPTLDYTQDDMEQLALQVIRSQTTLTGVQPKLSLNLTEHEGSRRLTIVGLWGEYIFKPQTADFEQLPEVEDLTMHLAEIAKLQVAQHSLIRLADNSIGYLTKRFDRTVKGEKIPTEDMCQLAERKTEDKYRSSYEQVGKLIANYSSVPALDLTNYFELLLFCWITGNNDMHLKNFSLYRPKNKYLLSPAYDLLNVVLVNPLDKEDLALTLNGKKANLKRQDFEIAAERLGLPNKFVTQTIARYQKLMPQWEQMIDMSFLSEDLKDKYIEIIHERMKRIM